MPFIQRPATDNQRTIALETAEFKAANTDPTKWAISAETRQRLTDFLPVWRQQVNERSSALSVQSAATEVVREKRNKVKMITSHFFQVFNMAIARDLFAAADRAHYGLDVSQESVPAMKTEADVMLWANRVITGEAARVAAGGAAMAMPSAAEVQAAIDAFNLAKGTQTTAKDTYDKEQKDVEDIRDDADELIEDIWDEVEFKFRKEDPPSLRRKAREWGVYYATRPDETPESITVNIAAGETMNIGGIIVEDGGNLTITNNGPATVKACRAANPEDACATGTELAAGDEFSGTGTELEDSDNSLLNITNLSGTDSAEVVVTVG